MTRKLTPEEITRSAGATPMWTPGEAHIDRTFRFADFAGAMVFVNAVAALAEEADHHPDIDIRWNRVALRLSTHSAGGLTARDFSLAAKIDGLAPDVDQS